MRLLQLTQIIQANHCQLLSHGHIYHYWQIVAVNKRFYIISAFVYSKL